jgi:hypothetical protein
VRHAAFDVRGYFLACFFCDDFWNDMESVQCVANTFFCHERMTCKSLL